MLRQFWNSFRIHCLMQMGCFSTAKTFTGTERGRKEDEHKRQVPSLVVEWQWADCCWLDVLTTGGCDGNLTVWRCSMWTAAAGENAISFAFVNGEMVQVIDSVHILNKPL